MSAPQVSLGVGINCAACCGGPGSFKLKSVTVYLPYCGINCFGYNSASPSGIPGPTSLGLPQYGGSGCDNDQNHICENIQFLSTSYLPYGGDWVVDFTIDQLTCIYTGLGWGGYPNRGDNRLSSPSTIPVLAQSILSGIDVSALAWGQHIIVYPLIDSASSANGDCPCFYGYPYGLGNTETKGPCFTGGTNSTTYTYSADTIPSWIGGSNVSGIAHITAVNTQIYLENCATGGYFGQASILAPEYWTVPGFPDATYGNPPAWWCAQIVIVECDNAPYCVVELNRGCAADATAAPKLVLPPTCNASTIVTLHPTFAGDIGLYMPLGACPPPWSCQDTGLPFSFHFDSGGGCCP